MTDGLIEFLTVSNETLSTIIVISAASLLLYNLVRNLSNRVTRAASILLGCVTMTYVADSLVGLDSDTSMTEVWFRMQWIGLAFLPAAMFHLADALLATTGLPSRGRRRRIVRLLYLLSTLFLIQAATSNLLVRDLKFEPVSHMQPGGMFGVYTLYFVVAGVVSMWIVKRARNRCLTPSTRRRMTYLYAAFLTPGLGLYPYSLLFEAFGNGGQLPLLPLLFMFNLANFFVGLMLVFMSYPLSFFGTDQPDRVVKVELLEFWVRGPVTAAVLLAVMVSMPRLADLLRTEDNNLMIIGVIAALLAMQWFFTRTLPLFQNWLIYSQDQQEARQLRQISEKLVTRADIKQMEEALLAATCDQLRAPSAFIVAMTEQGAHLEQAIGDVPDQEVFQAIATDLSGITNSSSSNRNGTHHPEIRQAGKFFTWRSFWLFPLHEDIDDRESSLLGIMGVWTQRNPADLAEDEHEIIHKLTSRAAEVLSDLRLQSQVYETLTELLTEMDELRPLSGITRYGQIQPELLVDSEEVRGALRDYWGGPKLLESGLLKLRVVQAELDKQDGSPSKALQSVLSRAIESLKPGTGENQSTPEWILYNILELRFRQGKKVRDVARQLFMSEPDFYRKQKIAIEEVSRLISNMERERLENDQVGMH